MTIPHWLLWIIGAPLAILVLMAIFGLVLLWFVYSRGMKDREGL